MVDFNSYCTDRPVAQLSAAFLFIMCGCDHWIIINSLRPAGDITLDQMK
jgi:hypothetical protein